MIHDIKALKKWNKIPKVIQDKLVANVFYSTCGIVKIVDYQIKDDKFGILLEGSCEKCKSKVAIFIEDD